MIRVTITRPDAAGDHERIVASLEVIPPGDREPEAPALYGVHARIGDQHYASYGVRHDPIEGPVRLVSVALRELYARLREGRGEQVV